MWGNQGGFDGDSGVGGNQGGYMTSPGGFGSPTPTQSRGKRAQNLIPCTISQILKSKQADDSFKCGVVELNQVAIVGVILNTDIQATHIRYELDDMSGPSIEIRQWIDNDENNPPESQPEIYHPPTYVKIIGSIRSFSGKLTVSPFKIIPLTDLNEITVHMLEVVHAHMYLTKKINQGGVSAIPGPSSSTTQTPNKIQGTQGGDYSAVPNHGLNNVQRQVHQLIVACSDEQGISMDDLRSSLQKVPFDLIKGAVEFLSNEGHIYSTIDDDHFKSTEG
ncbi:Replication protein A 32 kDa subunit [Holothuria leucospilota]|uniref:Replication protein A 32 kDa subunit n=1 Tax=Holothuria leucospilota TaxID=206669 RepID=A0A9Q1H4D0_HOLLE|nr:Replication protein A 32 kDa subunit [Holothuria leucospilota]